MKAEWRIRPKISDQQASNYTGLTRLVSQLLFNRGLANQKDCESFLESRHDTDDQDPFLFKQMNSAVELVVSHIKAGNLIAVYGDYDADGITATAVITEILQVLQGKTTVYLPDRTTEGYGINLNAIRELAKNGVKLIITVDTGIRNKEEINEAKLLGLDVVVTDHHEAPPLESDLPGCILLNPNISGETYPFKNLAGVGVAFKLVKALISKSTLTVEEKKKLEYRVLDLVAIGSIADCVNLIGENRVLVKNGLSVLNKRKRIGINALVEVAQIKTRELNAWNVGWQIGPRLNVAGRFDHANSAYDLLTTKDKTEASKIAIFLNQKNSERQKITEEIVIAGRKNIEQGLTRENIFIIACPALEIAGGEAWPDGILGLVAGRLCEEFYRPVLVLTLSEGEIKGSGRSIEQLDITSVLEENKDLLKKFGGHAAACGFTLSDQQVLNDFRQAIKKSVDNKLKGVDLLPRINIEAEIKLQDIDDNLMDVLKKFEPFGQGNPKPKFISRNLQIKDIVNMGLNGQHIKLRFNGLWAVAFNRAELWEDLRIGDIIDMVYTVEINDFNGRQEIQLKIEDLGK